MFRRQKHELNGPKINGKSNNVTDVGLNSDSSFWTSFTYRSMQNYKKGLSTENSENQNLH